MKRLTSILLAVTVLTWTATTTAHDYLPGKAQTSPILLKGGDLYTVANGVLPETDILFENGVITAIGKAVEPPPGTEVIDVTGKYVYPGLIAPNSLVGLVEVSAVSATVDVSEVGDITPEVRTAVAYNPDSEIIPTVRSNGVTTVVVAPQNSRGAGLITGRSCLVNLDGWTIEDAQVKADLALHVSWPRVGISQSPWVRQTAEEQRERNEARRKALYRAFEDARSYAIASAADPSLPVDIRWEAMKPVFSRELPVFVTADELRQVEEALTFAHQFNLRMVLVGGKDAWQVADRLAAENVPVILGRTQSMPMHEDDPYDLTYSLPSRLNRAGVRFCFSYGSFTGTRNLPFQAGQAAAYGLSQEEALRSVTLTTAEILGVADQLGSLEIGKTATIVVSDGDLLDNRSNSVELEFIAGRKVDLDSKHKELYRKYKDRSVAP